MAKYNRGPADGHKKNEDPACAAATYFGTSRYVLCGLAQGKVGQNGGGGKGKTRGAGAFPRIPIKGIGTGY